MKLTAHVLWVNRPWYDVPQFEVWPTAMSHSGPEFVHIKEIEVDVEIPPGFDPRPAQVDALREQKKKVLADAHVKAEEIEEKIQRLLALEFKG